ncbi:transporter [Chryseobacterium sp. T16E-39]|uniref:TolC family protein n=1 Tax=Chryseobacterium sp. T16E-39 TaxID=2015076 RepID=UPI000B5B3A58|nr:TolC family protein [Chryseobacterium sp. T16E-39]ASK29241.1 transporter [Chryseobacterium sp. T16E-39]
MITTKKYIKSFLALVLLSISFVVKAQKIDTAFAKKPIDYATYINLVGKNNLAYSAEKFNVNIADAAIQTARIFPDPQLGFGWFDNGQKRMKLGYGFNSEVSWTLEMGGKRKARIEVARNQAQLSRLLLDDYFRNLRADATLAYLAAIQNRIVLDVESNSYLQMKKLAESDSIRFKLGVITQVDARQSKLEAGTMLNDVFSAEADWKTSLANLSLLSGKTKNDSLLYPKGDFSGFERQFSLQDLVIEAQNNRADLKAALQSKHVSQSLLKQAKADRAIDLGLSFGVNNAAYVRNTIAPTPGMTTVNAGISIPLKFSNNRSGDLRAAQYGTLQAETTYKQTELQIQTEVTQAYFTYIAAQKQADQFKSGLLTEAQAILEGKIYSYKRGQSSLLEVLNAQRTYNDVQHDYYNALYSYAVSLVELERAAGIWDINF